jgi:hypothetical protein
MKKFMPEIANEVQNSTASVNVRFFSFQGTESVKKNLNSTEGG